MVKTSRSNTGLMLVEDPRESLKALCFFTNSEVDLASYKLSYEKIIGRTEKPIHLKHAHTHFYSLKIYGFLIPTNSKGKYYLSPIAKNLCALMSKPNNKKKYQQILSNILLTNESKGKLFENFLMFVKEKKTKKEIKNKFKDTTARSLIAWTKEAGLIIENKNDIQAIPINRKKVTQVTFRNTFIKSYKEMQKTEMFGIRRIYVSIGELKLKVCAELGLKQEEFYKKLKILLMSKYGTKISLHGAPTNVFKAEETFIYKGKLYIYLSMEV